MSRNSGFSIIEGIIGAGMLVLVLYAAVQIVQPVFKANKIAKIASSLYFIEQQIRNQAFNSTNYADRTNFKVMMGSVLLAQHAQDVYLTSDLTLSSTAPSGDIKVKLEVVDYFDVPSSTTRTGVVYQVSALDPSLVLRPLGLDSWDANLPGFLSLQSSHNDYLSTTWIDVPDRIARGANSTCASGFMRGISTSGVPLCWSFSENQCPAWSVPTGYKLTDSNSTISLQCQKLRKLECPPLTLSTQGGQSFNLNYFYAVDEINLADLMPRNAAYSIQSKCSLIINFNKYSATSLIPASVVNSSSATGQCPDVILYKKGAGGDCQPTFNAATIPDRVPASIQ